MLDLTDDQRDALKAIAALPDIWPMRDAVESAVDPGLLDELVDHNLVLLWRRPDGVAIVLGADAVDELGIVAEERWQYRTDDVKRPGEPGKSDRTVRARVASEIPRWTAGEVDEAGVAPRKRRVCLEPGAGAVLREKPVVPPGYAIEAPPAFLSFKVPPKKGTKRYRNVEDGEVTDDPAKATRLFAGPDGTGGVPVVVDPRLKRQRPIEAARRALAGTRKGGERRRA